MTDGDCRLHSDHLGSVAYTTSSSGALVSRQDYTLWGDRRGSLTIPETALDFTGQRRGTGQLFPDPPCVGHTIGSTRRFIIARLQRPAYTYHAAKPTRYFRLILQRVTDCTYFELPGARHGSSTTPHHTQVRP
jgi:hypothetical protein